MPNREILVVGASMGGVEALCGLTAKLPAGLPVAMFVVVHMPTNVDSRLAEVLGRHSALPVSFARDGDRIRTGRILIAPPNFHMQLDARRVRLNSGARENRVRPAIDPLFRTAARYHDSRVIAVLLSGGLSDGTAGLLAVRSAGGVAVVQDPESAVIDSMPRTAIELAGADYVVPVPAMPALLDRLVREPMRKVEVAMIDPIDEMPETVKHDKDAQANGERKGRPSLYSCPECGGIMWQVDQDLPVRFRCHVGHAYYSDQLMQEQADRLEAALWTAVRLFRERATLSRQLSAQEQKHGNGDAARRFAEHAETDERNGDAIQEHLLDAETGLFSPPPGEGSPFPAESENGPPTSPPPANLPKQVS